MWPEILGILYNNLDSDLGVAMSLETLILVIEDSGNLIDEKYTKVNKFFNYYNITFLISINNFIIFSQ